MAKDRDLYKLLQHLSEKRFILERDLERMEEDRRWTQEEKDQARGKILACQEFKLWILHNIK